MREQPGSGVFHAYLPGRSFLRSATCTIRRQFVFGQPLTAPGHQVGFADRAAHDNQGGDGFAPVPIRHAQYCALNHAFMLVQDGGDLFRGKYSSRRK